jgi:soluble cytochrome b562
MRIHFFSMTRDLTMATDKDYYLEAAEKAASALATLRAWDRGGLGEPFNEIKDLARLLVDGADVHPEVMSDVGLKDRHAFREAVMLLARPTSYSKGSGNIAIVNALVKIQQVSEKLADQKGGEPPKKSVGPKDSFVDVARIDELKLLSPPLLDLKRLVRLLEELNAVYQAECYMATIMICRAIIDHVPPVFGFPTFVQVMANYAGTKSFKDTVEHLEKQLRKIADSQLHTPMRKSETLVAPQTVAFQGGMDMLVGEVIRVLQEKNS